MKIFKKSVVATSLSVLAFVSLGTAVLVNANTGNSSKTSQVSKAKVSDSLATEKQLTEPTNEVKPAEQPAPTTTTSIQATAPEPAPTKVQPQPQVAPTPKPQPGVYTAYSDESVKQAASGKTVLFFAASWCHTCRGLDQNINGQLSNIPAGVTILKVDYDSSTALKQKYGVTYQHTLVEINADGSIVHKWAASPTLQDVISEI